MRWTFDYMKVCRRCGTQTGKQGLLLALLASLAACTDGFDRLEGESRFSNERPTLSMMNAAIVSEPEEPYLRVINATPGTSTLELFTKQTLGGLSVGYGATSDYVAITDAWVAVEAAAGARQRWRRTATATEPLIGGVHYSAVVFPAGEGNGLATRVIRDELPTVTSTTALVRLVPAASDFFELSLYLSDRNVEVVLYPDLGLDDGFKEIAPYEGPVELREGGRLLKALTHVRLDAGTAITLVFARDERGHADVFILVDRPAQESARR